jgi:hypothetical protein
MSWAPNEKKPMYNDPCRFSDTPYSINTEPSIEYCERVDFLHVSSIDREVEFYPKTSNYRYQFEDTFKNVKSIKLIGATIPNQNNILDNSSIILQIDEINHLNFSSNNINKGFAVMMLKGPSRPTDGFIVPEMACNLNSYVEFRTPLAKLNSFTINLTGIDGQPIDFGESNGSLLKKDQNTLLFRIVTMEKNRDQLKHRNVY